jgi:uncharacterized protein (TIGR02145 family)
MGENLKTARYRNGDLIATTNPAELDILNTPQPRFQWAYEGSNSNVNIYGRLYTAFVVNDSRYLCPTGWHVPTDDEWKTLEMFLGMSQSDADKSRDELGTYLILRGKTEGAKLKEAGYQHWLEDASWLSADMRATNETGFTALPGGFRRPNSSEGAAFQNIDEQGTWWSSTVLPNNEYNWVRILYDNGGQILRDKFFMNYGFSVRCIKDN